jgi:hypothetical protein
MNCIARWFLASVFAAAWTAPAAPLNRADVPARPLWVAHMDCDALRPTRLGKYLLAQMASPEWSADLPASRFIFAFNLRPRLHGVTVYSPGPSPDETVSIVYADLVPQRLIAWVKSGAAVEIIPAGRHLIYGWSETGRNPGGKEAARTYGVFEKSRLVIGQRRASVVAAMAVIDQKSANLHASGEWPELGSEKSGVFAQGEARKLDLPGADQYLALSKFACQMKFQAAENGGRLNAVLTLNEGDESAARQTYFVARSLIALASYQMNDPLAAWSARNTTVKNEGSVVTATLSATSSDFVAALKTDATRK